LSHGFCRELFRYFLEETEREIYQTVIGTQGLFKTILSAINEGAVHPQITHSDRRNRRTIVLSPGGGKTGISGH
jgi:hypothetical protein